MVKINNLKIVKVKIKIINTNKVKNINKVKNTNIIIITNIANSKK